MKNQKACKSAISILLSLLMVFAVISPITAFAVSMDTGKLNSDIYLTSKTDYTIAPGITESHITTNNSAGSNQVQGYALEVDLSNPTTSVIASYKDYSPEKGWGMQKVRDQAYAAEKVLGVNVVAGTNGDFYNMGTGQPTGSFVMNGTIYNTNNSWNYFAILKDGTPVIGSGYLDLTTAKECIGGSTVLLKNGELTNDALIYGTEQLPRTAVGITADGNIVLFVADGRQHPNSCGQTLHQLAETMLAMGCADALSLDGGGSSTFISQHEGSTELVCRNSPSDGSERTVSSAILVCSSAKPSGEFDHATITPNNKVYTPGASVTFTATGVDSSGFAADLPSDGTLALADDSYGTITDGVFTSSGKTGTVVVNYITDGAVAGSTSIEIQTPDALYFKTETVSLAFDQQSDLGIIAKWKDRDINIKTGDLVWSLTDAKMGTFNGNIFTASPDQSVNGTITVKSAYDDSVTASLDAEIGRQPSVIWDFEDEDYYTFATGILNANGGIKTYTSGSADTCNMLLGTYEGRGGFGSAKVVDVDTGEVRMGENALRIDFDFTACEGKIDGTCIGAYNASSEMEGTPSAIGLWLYAPEGTPNLWLRIRVMDNGTGNILTLNFTEQGKAAADGVGGINWQGWKYVEAQLNGVGPYQLLGGECVRLMYCAHNYGNGNKTVTGGYNADGTLAYKDVPVSDCKGYVYIDNVQFVYGSNTQDVDNPVIDSISVGNPATGSETEIGTDTTINTNDVVLQTKFHDVQNKYTTGIDYENEAYRIYVDGKNVTEDAIVLSGDDTIKYYATLADGTHSIKVLLRDGFGNETVETRYFTVAGGVAYPTAKVEAISESCVLNKTYSFAIKTNDIGNVSGVTTQIKLDKDIVKSASDIAISYTDGFNGTYSYDSEKGILALSISGDATGNTEWNTLATLTFAIPYSIAQGKNFTYRVTEGTLTYKDATIVTDSFASSEFSVPVTETYTVTSDTILVGSTGGYIYVTDAQGNAVADANIIKADGSKLGTTDAEGKYLSTEYISAAAAFTVYAEKNNEYSFTYTSQSFPVVTQATGAPEYILTLTTEDPSTQKKFSWLSNPLTSADKAVIQYAETSAYEADGEAAFTSVNGKSTIYEYNGETAVALNSAARINSALITGLTPDTDYTYRVGDGTIWSATGTFTTGIGNSETSFLILGDIQANDMTIATNAVKYAANDGTDYDFAIQTGDAIEISNIYAYWEDILKVFADESISGIDMFHVFGNHEHMGDTSGLSSELIFDVEKDYYSLTYGNVYVAVINYTPTQSDAGMKAATEWLVEDANASDALWKVVTIHTPTYNTNAQAPTPVVQKYLPAACDAADIDAVFSGHDHSFARTSPLVGGEVTDGGTVYYICGNMGEKSYNTTDNPEYHFAEIQTDYSAAYVSVTASDSEMLINLYDVPSAGNGILIDTYTITKTTDCNTNGHTNDFDGEYLTCTVCGYTQPVGDFTGFVSNADNGNTMYLINGTPITGWFAFGEDNYVFDENGEAMTGTVEYEGYTYEFGEDGKLIKGALIKDGSYWFYYINGEKQRGWFKIDGNWYFFSRTSGRYEAVTGEKEVEGLIYTFTNDGKLIKGAFNETTNGTAYYWGPSPVTGLVEIDGETYYFNPENTYMVVNDTVEIDGEIYAFDDEGKLAHYGEHVDSDGDGDCDECPQDSFFSTLLEMLLDFFRRIKEFFESLFA